MTYTLIDAGPIIAYYNSGDSWHAQMKTFLNKFTGQFITTCPVITEAMYLLSFNHLVQNELLSDLSRGLYSLEPLEQQDFARIAELNIKYRDLPGDFADLTLVAISERLQITNIASFDSDFDVYRRYRKSNFNRVFPNPGS